MTNAIEWVRKSHSADPSLWDDAAKEAFAFTDLRIRSRARDASAKEGRPVDQDRQDAINGTQNSRHGHAGSAARDALRALFGWPESEQLLHTPVEHVITLAKLGSAPAILMLPACMVFRQTGWHPLPLSGTVTHGSSN
jgi:hypothetical protein